MAVILGKKVYVGWRYLKLEGTNGTATIID
jgi:hypothetical protein